MRILHTSDWHVGKVLKGQARLDEQIARARPGRRGRQAERPDLVIVAGDLYDTAAPHRRRDQGRHPGAVRAARHRRRGRGDRRQPRQRRRRSTRCARGPRRPASRCAARSANSPTST